MHFVDFAVVPLVLNELLRYKLPSLNAFAPLQVHYTLSLSSH